ncbi:hypothetical protein M3Y99_01715400 [Aphelenchoides fujianensis]|nr:hypothetical protein M3Y99_01715400 [Aphelenchoides fujianensis]
MDEKKKPKMRMDVRRSLMFQSLNLRLPDNQLPAAGHPDFLQRRAALRFRTLRFFFCSRSFPIAFFTRSKRDRIAEERAFPVLDPTAPGLTSASFSLHLDERHLRLESFALLLQLGQRDIRCLRMYIYYLEETFEELRKTTFMLSAVQNLPHLKAAKMRMWWQPKAAWLLHLLRDFLPTSVSEFYSQRPHDHLLFVLPPSARSQPIGGEVAS